ncbi:alpha-L-fucosidase, partial [Haloferula sp.]|uniref:alpha-L-fucosidase n=1 Tax=Haloferula sp. TaxID=2497595 RepID=UPI003C77F53E
EATVGRVFHGEKSNKKSTTDGLNHVPFGPEWFWTSKEDLGNMKPAGDIVAMLERCNQRNANYLLNISPDKTGLIPDYAMQRAREVGEILRDRPSSARTTQTIPTPAAAAPLADP